MNVGIKGFGAYAPEKSLITLISKVLETSDEWISKMTGIKERGLVKIKIHLT